jgi:hypothetical protein
VNDDPGAAAQVNPAVGVDGEGTAFVVWEDLRDGPAHPHLRWAKQPAEGVWSASQPVGPAGPQDQRVPSLAVDRWNAIHLIWEHHHVSSPGIHWAVLPHGANHWQGFLSVNDPAGSAVRAAENPDVGVDAAGTTYAVWQDSRNGEDDPDIYGARLLAGGAEWGPDRRVNHDAAGNRQSEPALSVPPDGSALAVWTDERTGDPDVFLARYLPHVDQWDGDTRLNDDPIENAAAQEHPDAAQDGQGNGYVVWVDHRRPGTAPDVYSAFVPGVKVHSIYMPLVLRQLSP